MILKQGLNKAEHRIMMYLLSSGERPKDVAKRMRVSMDYVNRFMEKKKRKIPEKKEEKTEAVEMPMPEPVEEPPKSKPKKRRRKTDGNK